MSDRKLTDDEVIKAAECCIIGIGAVCQCKECPLYYKTETYSQCKKMLVDNIRDLINRQKAEIERLQKYNTDVAFQHYNDGIKEFADKVIDLIYEADDINAVSEWQIRNLVKEMTEGGEPRKDMGNERGIEELP